MMGDLFSKLQEARQKIEESKKKLNTVIVEAQSADGSIIVKANATKSITNIEISESFLKESSKDEVEDLLLVTVNKALTEASKKGEAEMKEITKGMLPGFPGMG